MAYTLTYNNLYNAILSYSERNDDNLKDIIQNIILISQQRIIHDIKSLVTETYITTFLTPNVGVIQKPENWIKTLSINIGSGTSFNTRNVIEPRSYDYIRMYQPDPTQTGLPEYYSDYGYNNIILSPTPDLAYPIEICYQGVPEMIDESNQTNQITENYPHLLQTECLRNVMVFVKNDERVQVFEEQYQKFLQALLIEDANRVTDRTIERKD